MTSTRRSAGSVGWGWGLAAAFALAPLLAAHVQDAKPDVAPAARTPADAWAAVRGAYATNPTADRVTVTVTGADGSSKGSEHFEVRLDPRPGNAAGPRMRLDLGPIRLTAGDGRVAAAHVLSREGAFVAEGLPTPLTTPTLAPLLPPLPLPALAALTGGATPADALGYVRSAEWTDVIPDPPGSGASSLVGTSGVGAGGAGFTIVGRAGVAKLRLSAGASGRLRSLSITELPNAGSITAEFAALPAPDPADFDIGVQDWPRVATIRELFGLPPTPIDPGHTVPELTVQTSKGDTLVLKDALAKVRPASATRADGVTDVERDPPAAERIVLVIYRLPADPEACELADPGLIAARGALAELLSRSERDRFLSRAVGATERTPGRLPPISAGIVLVADLGEGNAPGRLKQGEEALTAVPVPSKFDAFAPRAFQSVSAAGTIGPFARNVAAGNTLLVVLTADWKLIRAELWPEGMIADQGTALIERRIRGE